MKREPIVSSETSAIRTQTPGNYPKRNKLQIFYSLQGKAPKEIRAILTESLTCFLPGRAKELSATPVDVNEISSRTDTLHTV